MTKARKIDDRHVRILYYRDFFLFSSRRRHTRFDCDWSSDVCSSDLELFIRVPTELTDGALALGSTRWEAIRGVMFAYAAPGIAAAVLLGLGRAFGEAIAVNQTIGNHNAIPSSWFAPGDSLGSKIASEYVGAGSLQQSSSILYLAAILMVISLVTH